MSIFNNPIDGLVNAPASVPGIANEVLATRVPRMYTNPDLSVPAIPDYALLGHNITGFAMQQRAVVFVNQNIVPVTYPVEHINPRPVRRHMVVPIPAIGLDAVSEG